jgi:CubicO group peptidase (beta-lactamase class C family)
VTVEPRDQAPAIELVPFVSQNFALQGLAPQGWSELRAGTFMRLASPGDQAVVIVASYANAPQEWLRYYLTRALPILEFPPSLGSRQTPSFSWDLYSFEGKNTEGFLVAFDLAVARAGTAVHAIFLQSPLQEHEALQQAAFVPMLDALEPLSFAQRDQVTAEQLMATDLQVAGPVHNVYFAPLGEHAAAKTALEGTLTVPEFKMSFGSLTGQPTGPGQDQFPGFSARFFTHEGILVPVESEILPALDPNSFWRIILSPGEVWTEPGDGGMSRAAFPFLLVSTDSNEAHNGLATFLYDGAGVSSLRFQVVQETCPWNRFDAWGQHTMSYEPEMVTNRQALVEQLADQFDQDLAVRPWSELEAQHNAVLLGTFTGPVDLLDISATGVIMEDTIYMQACYTRYGNFPYCQHMRHGIFSVTKSLGAAVAMLRLAQRYGEEVFDLHITDYVSVPASHDGWQAVTFGDAINQATGIGDDPSLEAKDITSEEATPKWNQFAAAKSAQEKLDVIGTYANYPWGPGEVARYNSTNVFVLAVAMDRFLKSKQGPQADIWDTVLEDVYRPIGIYSAPIMRTLELDGSRGVPIFGYGMYPTVQDMAKIALLLRNGGQHQGSQLLHAGKLEEILLRIEEAGLPSSEFNAVGEGRYHLSFWAMPYRSQRGDRHMIPYMSGFGGNRVVFNPNGIISFRVTDALNYELDHLVRAADGIEPFVARSGQ